MVVRQDQTDSRSGVDVLFGIFLDLFFYFSSYEHNTSLLSGGVERCEELSFLFFGDASRLPFFESADVNREPVVGDGRLEGTIFRVGDDVDTRVGSNQLATFGVDDSTSCLENFGGCEWFNLTGRGFVRFALEYSY